jgi:hypothetical protein
MHRVMVRTLRGLEAVARTEVHQLLGPVPVALDDLPTDLLNG